MGFRDEHFVGEILGRTIKQLGWGEKSHPHTQQSTPRRGYDHRGQYQWSSPTQRTVGVLSGTTVPEGIDEEEEGHRLFIGFLIVGWETDEGNKQ